MDAPRKPLLVIYRAECDDGFAGAWVVRAAIGDENVAFYPARYGDPTARSARAQQ